MKIPFFGVDVPREFPPPQALLDHLSKELRAGAIDERDMEEAVAIAAKEQRDQWASATAAAALTIGRITIAYMLIRDGALLLKWGYKILEHTTGITAP
jgi:hypothetical protein